MATSVCPACPTTVSALSVETWLDRIGGREYRILRCRDCGVVFSEPREAVGADWYEKAAPLRDQETRPAPERDWRFRAFFKEKLPPGKLLDVGCGGGEFLALAKERDFSVAGFDYERRMVESARSRGIAEAEWGEFDDYCRRKTADAFDYISLFDVLEHVPEPGLFLTEIRRLLKKGGHIVVTLPNAERPLPWGREEHDYPPHHFTRWSPEAMRGFLERHGFFVVRQETAHLKVSYLNDHLFFYVLMPGLLALARGVLFGKRKGTITELYKKTPTAASGRFSGDWRNALRSTLSDKLCRQRLVNAFKSLCAVLTYPLATVMTVYYLLKRDRCGDCLYTLARLETK